MKKLFLAFIVLIVVVAAIVVVRALMFTAERPQSVPSLDVKVNTDSSASHLATALSIPTVSNQDAAKTDTAAFRRLHAFLAETYPTMHTNLQHEVVGGYSLLFRWQGGDTTLKPALLMAHQDVVPVVPGTEQEWTHPPFGGKIDSGYIWGRGALDDKAGVIGICEAVEALTKTGFQPKRTIYLSFGHDEEISGLSGAVNIAALLKQRGVQCEYVLDEGGIVAHGIVPNVSAPVALIGISEKGYLSVELRVISAGGHSSMPPPNTAVGILSHAIAALEDHQMPAHVDGVTETFLDRMGRETSFGYKLVFANMWLFAPLVERLMAANPTSNASIRTTTAPTMLAGSPKENVLPIMATAVVNFRISPSDNVAAVLEHVKNAINDPRVKIRALGSPSEPSPISDVQSTSYKLLERTITQVFGGDHVVMPYLVVGATDARYFTGLSANVYRFLPNIMTSEDLQRVHGTNERISVTNFQQAVKFYYQIIRVTNEL